MYQDMPRMQDFAPFTPELLGALNDTPAIRTTSQARWASPYNISNGQKIYIGHYFLPIAYSARNSQKYLVVIWTT
jgi:hypothetical protein